MITCTNCKSETFKAEKLKSEPGAMIVRLTCAKCGHRVQVWIENAALKELTKEIEAYNEIQHGLNETIQMVIDYESKSWWRKLLGGRWVQ
jgi:transcription elongation factor Elf1